MSSVFEVRYDDEESYHVAARFTDQAKATRLRDRLYEAHMAADKDDCHFEAVWDVVPVEIDDVDPDVALPADLFWHSDYDDGGHAGVNIDRVDLSFVRSRATPVSDDTEGAG